MSKSKFDGFTSTPPKAKKSHLALGIFLSLLVLVSAFLITFKIFTLLKDGQPTEDLNFPKIEISLAEVPIEKIDVSGKSIEYPNNDMVITINDKSTTYTGVEIKGRGNHTWEQPKKPYQIKLSEKTSLFDFNEAKKWILLANYSDPSYIRNDIGLYLANTINMDFGVKGVFVELYIDNLYRGLYYLTEKVEINKSRVPLRDENGILVELDNSYGYTKGCTYDNNNNCITIKETVNEDNVEVAKDAFIYSLNSLFKAINRNDFKTIDKLIDTESFAKYYLVSEFVANPDAYSSSFFMYKDGENDKIHAGPSWDFDISIGNDVWHIDGIDYDTARLPETDMPYKEYTVKSDTPYMPSAATLFYDLMDIPEFKQKVKEVYQETLSGKKTELLDHVKKQIEYIKPAVARDIKRWKLEDNFEEESAYVLDWISKRYDHFEETYGQASETESEEES